MGLSKRIGKSR